MVFGKKLTNYLLTIAFKQLLAIGCSWYAWYYGVESER